MDYIGTKYITPVTDVASFEKCLAWCDSTGKGRMVQCDGYIECVVNEEAPKSDVLMEIAQIEEWFENYDLEVKKHERLKRLGLAFDQDIEALDKEAVDKAARLKQLRKSM